jgi:glycosyltransferase involved in cell wall biosynthesis
VTTTGARVLLVTKGLDRGGIERAIVDLAIALPGHGIDVEVAAVNGERAALVDDLQHAGVLVHQLPGSDAVGWKPVAPLRRLSSRFDLVHAHGPMVAATCRVVCVPPVIASAHSEPATWRRASRLAWAATNLRSAGVSAVSSRVAGAVSTRRHHAQVLGHGVDPQRVQRARAGRDDARALLDVADDCRLVCMIATHRAVKNHADAIAALRMLNERCSSRPPTHLVMIGDGPLFHSHRATASRLGVDEVTHFVPSTDSALAYLAAADALLVASASEGQPMVVVEALSVGVPVVSTDVGNVRDVLPAGAGRLVETNDVSKLADALAEVLFDDGQSRAAAGAAASRVPTVDDSAAAFARWYRQVVHTRGRHG